MSTALRIMVLVASLAVGVWLGVGGLPGSTGEGEDRLGRVVRVVDGDTIEVAVDGRREKVRYIGVDTPETHKPGTPVQCFGPRASKANERLVGGREVRLVSDAESRDRYGRTLAYVYRASDGGFVNAALVRDGYARTLSIAPNVRHAGEFAALASTARAQRRGLWGRCRR